MGDAMFPVIWSSFRHWRRHFGMQPRSMADLGCGTGRFLNAVAKTVNHAYGLDKSKEMLRIAHLRNSSPNVAIFRQDVRRFRLPRPVDLVTANFDTLNYVTTPSGLGSVLRSCNRQLRQRGHLYFDLLTGDGDRPAVGVRTQTIRLPDTASVWTIRTGHRGSRTIIDSVGKTSDGRMIREKEQHNQRWYPSKLIERQLSRGGFRMLGSYEFGTTRPSRGRSFWIQVIAQKTRSK